MKKPTISMPVMSPTMFYGSPLSEDRFTEEETFNWTLTRIMREVLCSLNGQIFEPGDSAIICSQYNPKIVNAIIALLTEAGWECTPIATRKIDFSLDQKEEVEILQLKIAAPKQT